MTKRFFLTFAFIVFLNNLYAQSNSKLGLFIESGLPVQRIKVIEASALSKTTFKGFNFAAPVRMGINIEKDFERNLFFGYNFSYLLLRQVIRNHNYEVVVRNYYNYTSLYPYIKLSVNNKYAALLGPELSYLLNFKSIDKKLISNPIPTAPYIPEKIVVSFSFKLSIKPINQLELHLGYTYNFSNFSKLSPIGPRPTALFYSDSFNLGAKYLLIGP